jgi:hypothetical protein
MKFSCPFLMLNPESLSERKEKSFRVLRVGLDADDTCFDVRQSSLKILNATYNTHFAPEDIKTFWYMQAFLKKIGVSKKDAGAFFDELYRSPDDPRRVYRNSIPLPGAVSVINGLHRAKHQLLMITTRPPGLEKILEEQFQAVGIDWIKGDWAEGGNILIRDGDYWQRMTGEEFKLRAIRGDFPDGKYKDFPGVDVHLDDMGLLLDHPLAAKTLNKIFIIGHPYNSQLPPENLVKNWWVFYKVVRCLARGEDLNWLMSHNIKRENFMLSLDK